MAGVDGKSCSKGHPSQPGHKKQSTLVRGKSFARPTQLTSTKKEKIVAAKQNKKPAAAKDKTAMPSRQGKVAKAYDAAKKHLAQVAKRTKTAVQSFKPGKRPKLFPEVSTRQMAGRRAKKQTGGGSAKTRTKTQQKAPTPPAPVRRK